MVFVLGKPFILQIIFQVIVPEFLPESLSIVVIKVAIFIVTNSADS
jgi:hypothetical protein